MTDSQNKSDGGKFLNEFNENCAKLQDYCDSLAAEVDARKDIIHLLTDAYTSCTASISQLVQTIKEYKDADSKIGQLNVMFEMRLQSCDGTGDARRDVITEEVDMELDSDDEEIDEKLDRAYENSQKQARSAGGDNDYRISSSDSLLKAAAATVPQMDTLSLLKAIADTGALISPALQTQLEFIQQGKNTGLLQSQQTLAPSNMLQHVSSELDQPKPSVEDRLNKLIAHKNVAITNLQSITESQTPNQMRQFTNPYANTLISPPSAYLPQEQSSEQIPPSGQSTPLLDEAPDTEEHKTPNQYNQFASYTQGLYKPIEPSPDMSKEMQFNRDFYIPNETKKQRMESPIGLNLKVFDYKHGTSVRQPTPAPPPMPPPSFSDTPMSRMPQPVSIEPPQTIAPPHSISPMRQHPNPSYRPIMNQQHNIPLPPHLLNQPPPPGPPPSLHLPPNNKIPPYGMPDLTRHDLNINNTATSPSKEQIIEDRKRFHQQNPHFQTPPPQPPFFRPPPNIMPPGTRHPSGPPPFNFRMPPPNEPHHRFSRPPPPPFLRPPHNFQQHDFHKPNH
ncbi:hypothetical protein LOD99_7279 [Oopsacas minuta]|uniref:RPRD1A/B C-terminal domain-containing protein n=1 Tax=Oopsacas minuta TaxID=111878 RepID=A0AAV7JTK7_9METZ|nr:hypothetical protein LOD99_7279 [Oopsacas minuta]